MRGLIEKNVFILGTGGTIASSINHGLRKPEYTVKDFSKFVPEIEKAAVKGENIMNIDSSNMQPHHWKEIARSIYKRLPDYDGIVVTHGTDTISYTAAALSFMLQNLNKPVVLTGAQVPIWETNTDAKRNILNSISVAANADLAEVVVVFAGKIMRGNRTKKFREIEFDAFESVGMNPLGIIEHKINMSDEQTKRSNRKPRLDTKLESDVYLLKLYPGLNSKIIDRIFDLGYKGLIIEGYGAGNVSILENSLIPYIQEATNNKIPVVITTQCAIGASWCHIYETGGKALQAGAIPAYDMTSETALVKLMYVLGHTSKYDEIKRMMIKDMAGEITPGIAQTKRKKLIFSSI